LKPPIEGQTLNFLAGEKKLKKNEKKVRKKKTNIAASQ